MPDGERPAHRSTRRDHGAPADVLAQVRQHALDASESLFAVDPMLGDPLVQRGVDEFVEQVVDALRVVRLVDGVWDDVVDMAMLASDPRP